MIGIARSACQFDKWRIQSVAIVKRLSQALASGCYRGVSLTQYPPKRAKPSLKDGAKNLELEDKAAKTLKKNSK